MDSSLMIGKAASDTNGKGSDDELASEFVAMVGQRVRQARHQKAISRRTLSEMSGVSQRYLAQLESGSGNISVALLFKVSMALGYSPDRLLGRDEPWDPTALEFLSLYREADDALRRQVWSILISANGNDQKQERVCLIGLRGAGKTTLGRLLSTDLSAPFVELNNVIEEQCGMPVGEIMALYGEEGYRRLEQAALGVVTRSHRNLVLSVGGGIVSNSETFAELLTNYHTCWLRASPEEHMERVIQQGDRRPMAGNPKAMDDLKSILTSRETLYAKADISVDTSGKTVDQSRSDLLHAIKPLLD